MTVADLTRALSVSLSLPWLTPMIAARMAGPLPAEKTPLLSGENPSHNLTIARKVANPIPAGSPRSQKRNLPDNSRANPSTSPAESMSAWATMQVCSVSSETIPLEKRK
jgi:hypothetical protein